VTRLPAPTRRPRSTIIAASLLFLAAVLACACDPAAEPPPRPPEILFPADEAVYAEETIITFVASEDGYWSSDISGAIGSGRSIKASLTVGVHAVTFASDRESTATVRVIVERRHLAVGETCFVAATAGGSSRRVGMGSFASFLYSTSDEEAMVEYSISSSESARAGAVPPRCAEPAGGDALPHRPPEMRIPRALLESPRAALAERERPSVAARAAGKAAELGDARDWRMANPSVGTGYPGFSVRARLIAIDAGCELWLDNDTAADESLLGFFEELCFGIAIPRARELWGAHYDRNGDSRLSILMSGKLNAGNEVIGFFNPCDYFPVDDDPASVGYNPTSNEADVIYVSLPADEIASPPYSPRSIAATAAHEYQHLARFGKKTYLPTGIGGIGAPQEDSAFDEGMSHLTESLVGLGCSGGNALFARIYLM
jgi:hypothetical protein